MNDYQSCKLGRRRDMARKINMGKLKDSDSYDVFNLLAAFIIGAILMLAICLGAYYTSGHTKAQTKELPLNTTCF